MFKTAYKIAAAGIALAALPGVAQAGTATTTSTASFNVITQCSITGATVELGTFTVNNTFFELGQKIGYTYAAVGSETPGTDGYEGVTWGTINCDNGTPYRLKIKGNSPYNGILINVGGKTAHLMTFVKTIGGVTAPLNEGSWTAAWGASANIATSGASGVGTGTNQTVRGSAPIYLNLGGLTALDTDKFGVAGTYTDNLTYTLEF